MRKRWFIISAALLAIILGFVVALWFPPTKRIIVPLSYPTVTNKITQWRPVRVSSRGSPSDVRTEENSPGLLYTRTIFERGDPKFGPFTVVRASKLDSSNTAVELSTTKYALFSLLGRRHLFFTERHRWKEIQDLIHQ